MKAPEKGSWTMRPIGHIGSPYRAAEEVPRGPGARHETAGTLDILPAYEAGLKDIEGFSHLFVLWLFHQAATHDLVCIPPTDSRPHGVFSTRSPRRPNPIGLTVVRLIARRGRRLAVKGVDMIDGTPILDIKPYLSSVPESALTRGWVSEAEARSQARKRP
ncbi:MAG: tRNA (N6-threonylcarbamoyladenosine(37)-N6)-methyltransferase TrmO [Vicinamibacteria bacterium]|nr:tRNA (N6-threonylcarbamoyladenosine(37)-N6)-methyltransferase TrmO [Vicinamibacteria bacterium]